MTDINHREQLNRAVTNRNVVNIMKLLGEGVDPRGIDPNGNTFIHLAFRNCDSELDSQRKIIEILKIFLERGVDPNAANVGGFTALHLAMVHRTREVIKFLLDHGANRHARDAQGNTLLHYLVKSEFEKHEKFDVETSDSEIMKLKCVHFLNWLASHEFQLDCTNNAGSSPLHLAVQYNLQHVVLILLKHIREMDLRLAANKTLLHRFFEAHTKLKKPCIKFGEFSLYMCYSPFTVEIVESMLDKGLPVDACNEDNETVLHVAIKRKVGIEVLELLADKFTAVRAIDSRGKTALDLIIDEWWRDSRVDGYLRIVSVLIAKGSDISRRDASSGLTPVQQAVVRNNLELLRLLRDHGADLANVRTLKGENLLHLVHADETMIRFLVNEGVDINGCDNEGVSPLHEEVWQRCSPKVKLLLRFGANVDILDNNGYSILRKAICQRNVPMVKELLKYGVDICDYEILRHFLVIDNDVRGHLLRHIVKMSTAGFPDIEDCERAVGRTLLHGSFREECRREIVALQRCLIDDSTSLLDFLRMDSNSKCGYIANRRLRNLLNDPAFKQRFPNYSILLLATYLQTVRRKHLIRPAECAWYRLTGILLPHVCVERVLAHLSNVDLLLMIREPKQSLKRTAELPSDEVTSQRRKRARITLCVF